MWGENDELIATAQQLQTMPAQSSAPPNDNWGADDEIIATREDNDHLREYHAKRLMEARRQDAAAAVGSMPSVIREPFYAAASQGANVMSTVTRPFSKDMADYFAETKQQVGTRAQSTRKDDWSPWVSRMYGGILESTAQSVLAAPAGVPGMIASFAVSEANDALYEAEQAGLKGNDRLKYAAVQGAIEGSIAGVFQKFAPGSEKFISQMVSGVMKASGKQFLKMTAQEVPEELLTEVSHAVAEQAYGIDPNAADWRSPEFWQRMGETVVQTIGQVGLAHGVAKIARNRQKINDLDVATRKGFVAKQDAERLGLTPEQSANRESRKKAVEEQRQQLQQEADQLEKDIQPTEEDSNEEVPTEETEVRQDQPAPAEPAAEATTAPEVLTPPAAEEAAPTLDDLRGMMSRAEASAPLSPREKAQQGRTPEPPFQMPDDSQHVAPAGTDDARWILGKEQQPP